MSQKLWKSAPIGIMLYIMMFPGIALLSPVTESNNESSLGLDESHNLLLESNTFFELSQDYEHSLSNNITTIPVVRNLDIPGHQSLRMMFGS